MSVPPVRLRRFPVRPTNVKLNQLNPHLLCMLCGGYYVDATTIIECLHSFCKTCIVRYLETSHYCPQCDVQVHKTRPLLNIRPDKTLQDLVYKLVPGLFTSEMRKRREFYVRNPLAGLKKLRASTSPRPSTSQASVDERSEPEITENSRFQEDEKISLSLEFSPDGKPVDDTKVNNDETANGNFPSKRYLLCPSAVTMGLLKKFVRMKLNVPPEFLIDVFHTGEPLGDKYTLMDIAFIYNWRRRGPLRLFYCIYQRPKKRPAPEAEAAQTPVKKAKPAPVPVIEYSDITKDASLLKQVQCEVKEEEKKDSDEDNKKREAEPKPETKENTLPQNGRQDSPKSAETKAQTEQSETHADIPKPAPAPAPAPAQTKPQPERKPASEPPKNQPESSKKSPSTVSHAPSAANKHHSSGSKSNSPGSKTQPPVSKVSHGSSHHEKSRKSSTSGSSGKSSSSSYNGKSHTSPPLKADSRASDSSQKKPPLKLTLSVPQAPGIARVIKETVTRAHNGEGKVGKDGVIDYSTDIGRKKPTTVTAAPVVSKSNKSPSRPVPPPIKIPMEGPKPKLDDNFNHSTLLPPTPTQEGRPRVIKENNQTNHTHAHTPPAGLAQGQSQDQGKKKENTTQGEQEAPLDLHTRPKVVEVS